jgi:gamma-glutamylcyclotransferase (GGCT)/AIG2-like uncharacterized protein YtfP
METKKLYFAYGSNLNKEDLQDWCLKEGRPYPLGEKIGNAYLADMQLVFNYDSKRRKGGALNIRHRLGQATPGVLYKIDAEGWETLDIREGAPNVYKHLDVMALTEDGREYDAATYQVHSSMTEGGFVKPGPEYLQVLKKGLSDHGINERMLMAVAEDTLPPWCIERLFVYGTLKDGGSRHHILKSWGDYDEKSIAKARGILFDIGKGYPCMAPAETPDQYVTGEAFRLNNLKKVFEMLDIVEAVKRYGQMGALFRRAITRIETEDGNTHLAWCYISARDTAGLKRIESGKWEIPG